MQRVDQQHPPGRVAEMPPDEETRAESLITLLALVAFAACATTSVCILLRGHISKGIALGAISLVPLALALILRRRPEPAD